MEEQPILAWYFANSRPYAHEQQSNLSGVAGETVSVEGEIELMINGLHAYTNLLKALERAYDPILYRVEIWGDLQRNDEVVAGRYCKLLWIINLETFLHEFACDIVEEMLLSERANGREPDPRCWTAVNDKRRWLRKEISDKELLVTIESVRELMEVRAPKGTNRQAIEGTREAVWLAIVIEGSGKWVPEEISRAILAATGTIDVAVYVAAAMASDAGEQDWHEVWVATEAGFNKKLERAVFALAGKMAKSDQSQSL